MKTKSFCFWNGGIASCLSLYQAKQHYSFVCLVSPLIDNGDILLKSHICSTSLLRAQADALKLPLLIFNVSAFNYLENSKEVIQKIKAKHAVENAIGSHVESRDLMERDTLLCQSLQINPIFPLWEKDKDFLLSQFLDLGFKSKIIAVHEKKLSRDYLGRDFDKSLVEEFRQRKIDIMGENGEFSCAVFEGPLFMEPLSLRQGDISLRNGYWLQDIVGCLA